MNPCIRLLPEDIYWDIIKTSFRLSETPQKTDVERWVEWNIFLWEGYVSQLNIYHKLSKSWLVHHFMHFVRILHHDRNATALQMWDMLTPHETCDIDPTALTSCPKISCETKSFKYIWTQAFDSSQRTYQLPTVGVWCATSRRLTACRCSPSAFNANRVGENLACVHRTGQMKGAHVARKDSTFD